ncbi:MAG: nuclear transport factor 2 family protein [Alphaproteobacteria bacterium]|nr:nuclear transport factor 2 family protein [Alphaproteobacteria bacterium]
MSVRHEIGQGSTCMKVDPTRTWAAVEAAYEAATNPRHKKLLKEVRDHMKTEVCGEIDALMATLTAEPQYHIWGQGPDRGPKGREAVLAFYTTLIGSGGNLFEFNVEKIIVDDDAVVTEGTLRNTHAGSVLLAAGVREVNGEPVDAGATYVSSAQLLTVWPADPDGKLIGEDIYFGTNPFDRLDRLAPADAPQAVSFASVS